jgi:glyoxylase-like metal-dependent hydrolase (beta-lactamase superfamily II)
MHGRFISFVIIASLGCANLAAAAEEFSIAPLSKGVFAIVRNDPPGFAVESNSGFIECGEHLVVIDAQSNEATTRRVLAAIRSRSAKPVKYVINTHWHDDHIVGNQVYREAFPAVKFVAHQQSLTYLPGEGKKNRDQFHRALPEAIAGLRKTLEAGKTGAGQPSSDEQRASLESDIRLGEGYMSVPDDFVPVLADVPVSTWFMIREAGCSIDVLALGDAHTTGDLVVHIPDRRVVFVGDIVGWPVPLVGAEQSRVRAWGGTLQRILDLNASMVVPGHGPVMRDYAHLDRIKMLMTTIAQRVDDARLKNETLEAARSRIDLSDLRQEFSNGSPVHAALFDAYVAGPAVTNAWKITEPALKEVH